MEFAFKWYSFTYVCYLNSLQFQCVWISDFYCISALAHTLPLLAHSTSIPPLFPSHTLSVRTLSHLCHLEKLAELVTEVGFGIVENRYIQKETINRKEDLHVPRVFIQGKFVKPCAEHKPTDHHDQVTIVSHTDSVTSQEKNGSYK